MDEIITHDQDLQKLCKNAIWLVKQARKYSVQQINQTQVVVFFTIGQWIVEVQQSGNSRASYGKKVLEILSKEMNGEFGGGFSVATLTNIRKFYLTYKDRMPINKFFDVTNQKSQPQVTNLALDTPFKLSWSHYLILMRIEDENERNFYEIETQKGNWGKRELSRQYTSSLYERILIGKDKKHIMNMAKKGHTVDNVNDVVKDPYVLEFLGLKERVCYSETELERRIIDHLQEFLLELGKGFTFVARQKRFTFEEEHFRVDLVFYNRLLQCFVLFDLKIDKLKHQDLGQMQMYVNYYDRYEKAEFENPTIGILLCPEKNDAIVELTLPKNSNIYASRYELYLPNKKELQNKLKEWISEDMESKFK